MSPANKHRGLIGDRDRDTEIFCHDFGRIYAQPTVFCFGFNRTSFSRPKIRLVGLRLSRAFGTVVRLKSRTGPVPTEPPSFDSDCLPIGPPSDRIRSDCRVAEQAPPTPVKRCLTPHPAVPKPSACSFVPHFADTGQGTPGLTVRAIASRAPYLGRPLIPKHHVLVSTDHPVLRPG